MEWLLLTDLPVDTTERVLVELQWYLCRWQIEVYFRILKSGCRIEELQLEKLERPEPALAFYTRRASVFRFPEKRTSPVGAASCRDPLRIVATAAGSRPHRKREFRMLRVYMIIAWRVLFLTVLGRDCPEVPCDVVFDTAEWQAG